MENASKALIIIAGVMIALIIVSIGVLLKWNLTQVSDSYVEKLDKTELQKYNNYFEIYLGRENITAQDIITAVGVAKQKDEGTKVWLKDGVAKDITEWSNLEKNDFLSKNILLEKADGTVENIFKCNSIDYDSETGKVNKITFEKIQ